MHSRPCSNSILIVCALQAEARPFIEHYRLKRDCSVKELPVFTAGPIRLVVRGPGKVEAAIGATHLLARTANREDCVLINVGIAGFAGDPSGDNVEHGDLFLVNRIIDHGSGLEYYPDMLVSTGCREQMITTFYRGVEKQNAPPDLRGLVDMEAAGVYQAGSLFLPPHRLAFIKIVSDFLDLHTLEMKRIEQLVRNRLTDCVRVIEAYAGLEADRKDVLDSRDLALLAELAANLRLTVAQREKLQARARCCRLQHGQLPDLEEFLHARVKLKEEGKRLFARLEQVLQNGKP